MSSSSLRVSDYMSKRIVSVAPDTPIMDAVYLLVAKDLSGVPVIDAAGKLVGILTERDCIAVALESGYFDEPGGAVADFMHSPVDTVGPSDGLMDVAVRFRDTSRRRFPVVEGGQVIGMLSRRDVLRALKKGTWFSNFSKRR